MNTVVLTFPGHLLHTVLCIRSLHKWYPGCDQYDIIVDDVDVACWPTFLSDAEAFFHDNLSRSGITFVITPVSTLTSIAECHCGWWRQQLVKLTLHEILPHEEFFVVDGDVIFDSHCDVHNRLPITERSVPDMMDTLNANYVRNLLGIDQGMLLFDGQPCVTNPIPFRYLTSDLLRDLNLHIKQRFGKNLIELHLAWFLDQTIVAFLDDPMAMAMSEWELIECYRRYVLHQDLPMIDIGSGYPILTHTADFESPTGIFRHGYVRDWQLGQAWFQQQNLQISELLWQRIHNWTTYMEPHRNPII